MEIKDLHRDIREAVEVEYTRLNAKHPTVDHAIKLRFSMDYVRSVAIADTLYWLQVVQGVRE